MSTQVKRCTGIALIAAGVVLLAFFPDLKVLWFTGRPFGFVLVAGGILEVMESFRRTKPKGIFRELGEDFGLTAPRDKAQEPALDKKRAQGDEQDPGPHQH